MYHSLIHVPFHDLLIITFWYNKHGRLRVKYEGSQLLIHSGNFLKLKKKKKLHSLFGQKESFLWKNLVTLPCSLVKLLLPSDKLTVSLTKFPLPNVS